ncbi:phosphonoacetaldehyde hydrolase [Gluconacetobacter asukensis]|uniref:Phosphonoacetaldehyde hydrolase n=1 Tax=Gluconacetobacter asukensis TaxID=1017181 RepID=A0A7W4P1L5_9PROT|nr:phosphonoacetaldehyde hydrolase [Gluconacetobacter asukensis]MBB2170835.1 phosphonoacetaldehyde hydrolase [Gluconacetobacter asukensis]
MAGHFSIEAVIFDWAGTLVDFGSFAPMAAFVETFAGFGLSIDIEEARRPMGLAKRPHVAALLNQPRIAAAWTEMYGHAPGDVVIDRVYEAFVPRNIAVAARHAVLIPGAAECVAELRRRGLRIGSTTGYTREIMEEILPVARSQGVEVDCLVCAGETQTGRPGPLMLWRNMIALNVWPAWRAVKVDDTIVGVAEGRNAGAWSVGVAVSGNVFGCTEAQIAAMSPDEFAVRRERARAVLLEAGAHEVIDSVADLPAVVERLDARLAAGERPDTELRTFP